MLELRKTFARMLLSLVVVGLPGLAGAAPQEHEEPGRYDQLAASYLLSDAAGKQQWLEKLLIERADPAGRVYLNAIELERMRERHRAILSRSASGRELSPQGVRKLLAEVDAQQQQAIAKLSRDYQFATAQAFHHNRAEFERWNAAWRRIDQSWRAQGEPLEWQPRIIDWLSQMTTRQERAAYLARRDTDSLRPIAPRTGPNIQHNELEARIAGYNLAMSKLISELHSRTTWSTEELGHTASELADLATARHDLALYWSLLAPNKRAQMSPLEPIDGAISLLAARTSARRRELENGSGERARTEWELRRLDDVSRRLATLAAFRS